jgi:uncharacterized protein
MRAILSIMILLCPFLVLSQTPVDIYQAAIPFDEATPNSRDKARLDGMEQVIIRATGMKEAAKNDVIQQALAQSDHYLSQVSTEQVADKAILKMQFNAEQIKQLLVEAKLPYWPPSRKNMLVWIIQDDGSQRSILWENGASDLVTQFKTLSEQRGLPVTIPVGDIDDVTAINSTDLWGEFPQPISQASLRYAADAVLIVRIEPKTIHWTLFDQKADALVTSMKEPIRGTLATDLSMDKLVDDITTESAKQQSIQRIENSTLVVTLVVNNINGAVDLFQLEQMLHQLTTVAELDVVEVQGESATYRTHILASKSDFERELLSTGMLVEKGTTTPDLPSDNAQSSQLDDINSDEVNNISEVSPISSANQKGSVDKTEPDIELNWQPKLP